MFPERLRRRCTALLLAGVAAGSASTLQAQDPRELSPGSSIYLAGALKSGEPLRAVREGGIRVEGAAAACVNCHRRSGLGSYEGNVLIPPIIGPYLFRDRTTNLADLTLPHIPGFLPDLLQYDDQSLALALRSGMAPGGRELSALMPRFALDDRSMTDLIDYLRRLSVGPMPGVGIEELAFATVVTPDTDPTDRAAMLEVLEKFIRVRNADIGARVQSVHSAAVEYRASRRWRLQVWQLSGPATTWERQLRENQTAHPVFAVLSGLGRGDWAPVHAFCEADHVPCLLPNVDLPVVAVQDFYPIYYSRGVLLESDLIRDRMTAHRPASAARLIQIYRRDDIGAAAAAVLGAAAAGMHLAVRDRVLAPRISNGTGSPQAADLAARRVELGRAMQGLRRRDTLVLWLRPADIAALGEHVPPSDIYASGLMANLEDAPLPTTAWRNSLRMTYPFDPPDLRRVRMNFPHAWFRSQGITVTNDLLQSDTYLTCMIVAQAIDSMLDSFVPEFLIERLEFMLDPRATDGYFPRLSLAANQRFASKGGYIVKFDPADRSRLLRDGEWITP